jgi:Ca-activated chloride channel family protein
MASCSVTLSTVAAVATLGCATLAYARTAAAETLAPHADLTRTLAPYFVVDHAPPGVDALPLKSTRVDARVSGVITDVKVTQIYRNEGTTPLEARYVFPASTRAAVYALRLRVGNRVVDAQIREKQQARAEYAQAQRAGKSAALLEQHRPNVLQMAIANVLPGDEIAVDLRYTESIVPTEGVYRFVFPTVVGPRYNGEAAQERASTAAGAAEVHSGRVLPKGGEAAEQEHEPSSHKAEGWIAQPTLRKGELAGHTFEFNATLDAPLDIQQVRSPSHGLAIDGVGTRQATARLGADRAHANRDVVLEYQLAGAAIDAGVLVHEAAPGSGEENFFLLLAEPPARTAPADIVPRDYVFIVDVSGSMRGFPLDTAKKLLRDLIGNLRPSDTFNVIPFAGGHSLLSPASIPASPENIVRALRFIDKQNGGGGTELLPALRTALAMPSDWGRARTFVVVTDGYVTIEKEAFDLVRANLNRANLFAFGIGSSVNRLLIEGLARAGKGEPFFVLGPQQAANEAARLRRMIEAPVLTRIRVRFEDFDAYDLDNAQIPDLFAERPIVLAGKFRGAPQGRIEIEGMAAGGLWRTSIDVAQAVAAARESSGATAERASNNAALRSLWARSRIATLADFYQLDRDDQTKQQVTALGLKYGLLTEFTSFIAVDKVVRNAGGASTSVDQPQPLPEGVEESALAATPSTPEPEFYALAALASALTWWLRRRRAHAAKRSAVEVQHG